MEWCIINGLLVKSEESLKAMIRFFEEKQEPYTIAPVPKENGKYVLTIIDPMET